MRSYSGLAVVILIVVVLLTPLFAQEQEKSKSTGVLATLKVGQVLNVKESGERYLVSILTIRARRYPRSPR